MRGESRTPSQYIRTIVTGEVSIPNQGGKRRRTPRRQDAAYGVSGGLPFGGEGGERGGGEGGGAVVARPSSGGDDVRATEAVARQLAEDEVELGPEGQAQRAASVRGGAASLSDGR